MLSSPTVGGSVIETCFRHSSEAFLYPPKKERALCLFLLSFCLSWISATPAWPANPMVVVPGWVSSVDICSSNLYVASNDGAVGAFRLADGQKTAEYVHPGIETPQGPVKSEAYYAICSPDGRWVVSAASSGRLEALDDGLKPLSNVELPETHSYSAVFAGPSLILVSTITGHVRAMKLPGLETLWKVKANWDSIKSIDAATSPGYFVTGSNDSRLRIRNLDDGALLKTLSGHKDTIYAVCFGPDGKKLLSGSKDHRLLYWDVETGASHELFRASGYILAVRIIADGLMAVSGSEDGEINLFSLSTFAKLATFKGKGLPITAFAYHDGVLYSGSTGGEVDRWNIEEYMPRNSNHNKKGG